MLQKQLKTIYSLIVCPPTSFNFNKNLITSIRELNRLVFPTINAGYLKIGVTVDFMLLSIILGEKIRYNRLSKYYNSTTKYLELNYRSIKYIHIYRRGSKHWQYLTPLSMIIRLIIYDSTVGLLYSEDL